MSISSYTPLTSVDSFLVAGDPLTSKISSKGLPLTSKPSLNASLYDLPVTKGVFIIILMSHCTTVTWSVCWQGACCLKKRMASFVSKNPKVDIMRIFQELWRFAVWKWRWQIQVTRNGQSWMIFMNSYEEE